MKEGGGRREVMKNGGWVEWRREEVSSEKEGVWKSRMDE